MRSTVALLLLVCVPATVWAGQAVSGLNGKIGYSHGNMDSDPGNNLNGSFSLPVGQQFGFQADGLYTRVSSRDFYGTGGHFFWRDSDRGLVGLNVGIIDEITITSYQGGLETEWYLQDFTLGFQAGWSKIHYDTGRVPFINTHTTKFYGDVELGYYPFDDLKIAAGYTYAFDNHLALGLIEYQTPVPGLSLYADVACGEHGYEHALFGIRFYFGKKKRLKLRHREDDPASMMPGILYNMGTYGSEYNRKGREYHQARGQTYNSNYGYSDFVIMVEELE